MAEHKTTDSMIRDSHSRCWTQFDAGFKHAMLGSFMRCWTQFCDPAFNHLRFHFAERWRARFAITVLRNLFCMLAHASHTRSSLSHRSRNLSSCPHTEMSRTARKWNVSQTEVRSRARVAARGLFSNRRSQLIRNLVCNFSETCSSYEQRSFGLTG